MPPTGRQNGLSAPRSAPAACRDATATQRTREYANRENEGRERTAAGSASPTLPIASSPFPARKTKYSFCIITSHGFPAGRAVHLLEPSDEHNRIPHGVPPDSNGGNTGTQNDHNRRSAPSRPYRTTDSASARTDADTDANYSAGRYRNGTSDFLCRVS